MDEAIAHCTRGIGIWEWAGNDERRRARRRARLRRRHPDARDARRRGDSCASTCPTCRCAWSTSSTSCACSRRPSIRTACPTREFDALFTADRPVIFAYHGYPWLIHRLTYRRTNHHNLHVRGYKEEGTTTTPFDMVMLNDLDRFHLVMDVDRPRARARRAGRAAAPGDGRRAPAPPRLHARVRRRRARTSRDWTLAGAADRGACGSSSSTPARAASSCALLDAARRGRSPRPTSTRRAPQVDDGRAARRGSRGAGDGRRRRPPDRPRRRALPRGGPDRRRRRARRCAALTDLAPLHQPKSLAALDAVLARAAGHAGRRLLRHRLPRDARRRRRRRTRSRARGASAGASAATASTASRTPTRRGARAELTGRAGGLRDRQLPPRRRRVARARCATGARSTRRWASRRSRGS